MKNRKALSLTLEQADAHQRRHGFPPLTKAFVEVAEFIGENAKQKLRIAPKMNKTESDFSRRLEAQRLRGEIVRWEFEGITLQWGGLRYTPDFDVFPKVPSAHHHPLRFIEIKGGFLGHGDAIVKFKAARANWPEFEFEMWQKKDQQWTRLA